MTILDRAIPLEHTKLTGVYFLLRRGVLVYVGQAQDIFIRISDHKAEGKKDFDSVRYILVSADDLNSVEGMLIESFCPEYNTIIPSYLPNYRLADKYGLGLDFSDTRPCKRAKKKQKRAGLVVLPGRRGFRISS